MPNEIGSSRKQNSWVPAESALAASSLTPSASNWRESKWLAMLEFMLVVAIFVADWLHFIPLSKTPFLLALGWASLRLRRRTWRSIGLTRFLTWSTTIALGVAAGIVLEAFQLLMSQPLLIRLTGKQPDLHDFADLRGNITLLLIYLALTWTLAAFGEEMVWRGYLMNRVADLVGGTRNAWIVSLILVHCAFGLAHLYQGITGIIDEGLAGLLLGVLYLTSRRNLSIPIVAHGVTDTIDMLLIFLGKYPGM